LLNRLNAMATFDFSESSASELMHLLLNRGYFHNGGVEQTKELESIDDSIETFQKQISQRPFPDEDKEVVQTYDSCYVTKVRLSHLLQTLLAECGGRLTKTEASMILAVNIDELTWVLPENTTILGDELMTEQYLDEKILAVCSRLAQSESGCLPLSDIALHILHLPMEFVVSCFQKRIDTLNGRIITLHGAKTLVTSTFDAKERARIRGTLRAITLPSQLDALSIGDLSYALPVIRDLCKTQEVKGALREQSGSLGMYIPHSYEILQRESVDEIFETQGYIMLEKCQALGISASSMGAFVTTSFPSAVCLPNSVVATNAIIAPLISVIESTLEENSFVDLKLHLAEALVASKVDLQLLIYDHVLPQLASSRNTGELVVSNGDVLFVSSGMIRRLSTSILPPLIESFAKRRAVALEERMNSQDKNDDAIVNSSSKGKKKVKQSPSKLPCSGNEFGVVPISVVAAKVAEEEPELANIQASYGHMPEANLDEKFFLWEQDEGSESSSGPLYDFCRIAFFNESFRNACAQAVEAELARLLSYKKAVSICNRKDGATRIRLIESAFEAPTCFKSACFQLQVHEKFLHYLETIDVAKESLIACTTSFLDGCCGSFASRITQYCLFKNELEGVFAFERKIDHEDERSANDSVGLPSYCQQVDITQTQFPTYEIRCLDEESGQYTDPLSTLRFVFSGNLGVLLSRTWTLCGGRCYVGGTRSTGGEDGDVVHPGNANEFMAHVEENCLSICSVPFKKLDKKSEKQYMFARRQELTARLAAAVEAEKVLELTVLLLLQQVVIKAGGDVAMDSELSSLIEKVRGWGLCKDISKYQVEREAREC